MVTLIACNVVTMFLFAGVWMIYKSRNKALQARLDAGDLPHVTDDFGKDLTDRENPQFRYTI